MLNVTEEHFGLFLLDNLQWLPLLRMPTAPAIDFRNATNAYSY